MPFVKDVLMRLQHWIAPALSVFLLLSSSRDVSAQYEQAQPPAGEYSQAVWPRHVGDGGALQGPTMSGPPINAGLPPYYSPLSTNPPGQAPYQPGMQPWPAISPYGEGTFSQTYIDKGLWMHESTNQGPRYFFSLEAIFSKFRAPKHRKIGSRAVLPTNEEMGAATMTREVFKNWDFEPGIRGRWEVLNPDGSGFEFIGWHSMEMQDWETFGRRDATEDIPETLNVTSPGLPLDDGLIGDNAVYDKNVFLRYDVETYGASAAWLLSPKIRTQTYYVQPLVGLRYFGVEEKFTFKGLGSGLELMVDDGMITAGDVLGPPFHGRLTSEVTSQLIGPEVGVRYGLGGKKFKIRGETKFAVMGNQETIDLFGVGLGNGANVPPDDPDPDVDLSDVYFYDPSSSFNLREVHNHVSPALYQSLMFDLHVFQMLPVAKRMRILEHAKLRTGFTWLFVWEVARPTDSILYVAPPHNPQIRIDRTDWWVLNWSFGVDWEY
jgi:hypothetical protein